MTALADGVWIGTTGIQTLLSDESSGVPMVVTGVDMERRTISMSTVETGLPRHWADLLSEFWGARSLHGAVFRQPRGVVFWHCERCRVPTNPSGTRAYLMPATTRKQVDRLCDAVRMWRQQERDAFIAAHARNYV